MTLFSPLRAGALELPNRVVMAPLGRARGDHQQRTPTASVATYDAQRATAGLIVSEAARVSADSVSRPGTAAIHSEEQVAAWRRVTDAGTRPAGASCSSCFTSAARLTQCGSQVEVCPLHRRPSQRSVPLPRPGAAPVSADAVAFGVGYIANPDLVERLRRGAPWHTPDPATFCSGGDQGYIDYPFLSSRVCGVSRAGGAAAA